MIWYKELPCYYIQKSLPYCIYSALTARNTEHKHCRPLLIFRLRSVDGLAQATAFLFYCSIALLWHNRKVSSQNGIYTLILNKICSYINGTKDFQNLLHSVLPALLFEANFVIFGFLW